MKRLFGVLCEILFQQVFLKLIMFPAVFGVRKGRAFVVLVGWKTIGHLPSQFKIVHLFFLCETNWILPRTKVTRFIVHKMGKKKHTKKRIEKLCEHKSER